MAEVQNFRHISNVFRAEQALLDIDRAVMVLKHMQATFPEAVAEALLLSDEGDPMPAFCAIGYLWDELLALQNRIAEARHAELTVEKVRWDAER